jgi:hypothetical protein
MKRSLALLLCLTALGCRKKGETETLGALPGSNVYLRSSIDADPSVYLGRFIPTGSTDVDEAGAMSLACSKFIRYRAIDGGGVQYTESLNISSDAALRLGIPVVASAEGAHSASRMVDVSYTLTGKMVAEIPDPDGFATCCKTQPDQCTDRYIGEFIQGTGAVQTASASQSSASGSGIAPNGLAGGAEASRSSAYSKGIRFDQPVYFAFKVTRTPYVQGAASTCGDWVRSPPIAESGLYVVGQSDPARSESMARNRALWNAIVQAAPSLGSTLSPSEDLSSSSALAGMRAEQWCVDSRMEEGDLRYVAKVLVYIPQESVEAALAAAPSAGEPAPGLARPPRPIEATRPTEATRPAEATKPSPTPMPKPSPPTSQTPPTRPTPPTPPASQSAPTKPTLPTPPASQTPPTKPTPPTPPTSQSSPTKPTPPSQGDASEAPARPPAPRPDPTNPHRPTPMPQGPRPDGVPPAEEAQSSEASAPARPTRPGPVRPTPATGPRPSPSEETSTPEESAESERPGRPGPGRPPQATTGPRPSPGQLSPIQRTLVELRAEDFESRRLMMAKQKLAGQPVTVAEAAMVLRLFDMEANRLMMVEFLAPNITDPQNGDALIALFDFVANKQRVRGLFD